MLAAQASDEGWTLSDGKLTVTGEVYSEYFSYWNDVQSIEVTGGFFALSDGMSFSGTITVLESGTFYNYGNVSGTISVESSCYFMNNGTISGGMVSGPVYNHGTIEVVVTVDGKEKFVNYGADILETLGASPTSLWYRVNADGTRALVREGDTFASLQKEAYIPLSSCLEPIWPMHPALARRPKTLQFRLGNSERKLHWNKARKSLGFVC